MITQLLYKWFGLVDLPCETCEVLRAQLDESNRERKELLHRLLDSNKSEPLPEKVEELQPIRPVNIPWRVRQAMLEAEDRKQAQLLKAKKVEMSQSNQSNDINKLEAELGIEDAPKAQGLNQ